MKLLQKYNRYLPSKKIQIIILALLGFAVIFGLYKLVSYFVFTDPIDRQIKVSFVDELGIENQEELLRDSDNDGVYDWKEIRWGLDPYNPDSDGDGIDDGEYIKIHNALQDREQIGEINPETQLTESQKLGRSLYAALLAVNESGGQIDAATEEAISGNIADYVGNLSFAKNTYTRDMLLLVPDTQKNSYAYRDAMKKIFTEYPIATSDIELIIKAAENPNNYKIQLRDRYLRYEDYLEKIIALPVPNAIGNQHTRLVNVVGQIEAALFNLTQEEVDDLVTLSSLIQMESIVNQAADTIVSINEYFEIINTTRQFEPEDEE